MKKVLKSIASKDWYFCWIGLTVSVFSAIGLLTIELDHKTMQIIWMVGLWIGVIFLSVSLLGPRIIRKDKEGKVNGQ